MSNPNIRLLADRVLVLPQDAEEKTAGGLVIPDSAKEKPAIGKVAAVGPGKADDKGQVHGLNVKAGEKVLYGKYSGTEVKLGDAKYLVMREEDIMAVVD